MNLADYKEQSSRTFANKLTGNETTQVESDLNRKLDILHCAVGASTETGELLDAFKRHVYYNKPLDVTNVGEEIADTMWYLMNLCRLLDLDMEKLLDNNINKLKVRYPEKFDSEKATNRDLEAERKELEK